MEMGKQFKPQLKIILYGYYGFGNAGDEAILHCITHELRQLNPHIQLVVLSNNPKETMATFGVDAVNRWHLPSIIKAMGDTDLVISGGGSLLQDVTGYRSIFYYLGVVRIAQALGIPTFFYSHGVGPIRGNMSKKAIATVANRVNHITVRDEDSAKLLRQLGVAGDIQVTADPVLGVEKSQIDLQFGRAEITKYAQGQDQNPKGRMGLILRHWHNIDLLLPSLAKWCSEELAAGWQLVFIPFHLPKDLEVGQKLLEAIAQEGNNHMENCVLLDRSYGTEEYLSIIGNLDFVISMRLHGLIMAAVMEVPLTGISYDPKVEVFLEQVDQPLCSSLDEELDFAQIMVNLSEALANRTILQDKLQKKLPQLREKAKITAQLALQCERPKTGKS